MNRNTLRIKPIALTRAQLTLEALEARETPAFFTTEQLSLSIAPIQAKLASLFSLTGTAPAITSPASTTFQVGTAGSFTFAATGTVAPTFTLTGALPNGLTLTNTGSGQATLTGTPAAGTGGTYNLVATASNGVMPNSTQNFVLTVNQAPAITSANNSSTAINSGFSFDVTTTGFPVATITTSGTLPAGVALTDHGDGTATLSGTPTQSGTFNFNILASNGVTPSATQSFTLQVNVAPAITSANARTVYEGINSSFTITTTGTPNPAITTSGTLPGGITFTDNGNGTATLSGSANT